MRPDKAWPWGVRGKAFGSIHHGQDMVEVNDRVAKANLINRKIRSFKHDTTDISTTRSNIRPEVDAIISAPQTLVLYAGTANMVVCSTSRMYNWKQGMVKTSSRADTKNCRPMWLPQKFVALTIKDLPSATNRLPQPSSIPAVKKPKHGAIPVRHTKKSQQQFDLNKHDTQMLKKRSTQNGNRKPLLPDAARNKIGENMNTKSQIPLPSSKPIVNRTLKTGVKRSRALHVRFQSPTWMGISELTKQVLSEVSPAPPASSPCSNPRSRLQQTSSSSQVALIQGNIPAREVPNAANATAFTVRLPPVSQSNDASDASSVVDSETCSRKTKEPSPATCDDGTRPNIFITGMPDTTETPELETELRCNSTEQEHDTALTSAAEVVDGEIQDKQEREAAELEFQEKADSQIQVAPLAAEHTHQTKNPQSKKRFAVTGKPKRTPMANNKLDTKVVDGEIQSKSRQKTTSLESQEKANVESSIAVAPLVPEHSEQMNNPQRKHRVGVAAGKATVGTVSLVTYFRVPSEKIDNTKKIQRKACFAPSRNTKRTPLTFHSKPTQAKIRDKIREKNRRLAIALQLPPIKARSSQPKYNTSPTAPASTNKYGLPIPNTSRKGAPMSYLLLCHQIARPNNGAMGTQQAVSRPKIDPQYTQQAVSRPTIDPQYTAYASTPGQAEQVITNDRPDTPSSGCREDAIHALRSNQLHTDAVSQARLTDSVQGWMNGEYHLHLPTMEMDQGGVRIETTMIPHHVPPLPIDTDIALIDQTRFSRERLPEIRIDQNTISTHQTKLFEIVDKYDHRTSVNCSEGNTATARFVAERAINKTATKAVSSNGNVRNCPSDMAPRPPNSMHYDPTRHHAPRRTTHKSRKPTPTQHQNIEQHPPRSRDQTPTCQTTKEPRAQCCSKRTRVETRTPGRIQRARSLTQSSCHRLPPIAVHSKSTAKIATPTPTLHNRKIATPLPTLGTSAHPSSPVERVQRKPPIEIPHARLVYTIPDDDALVSICSSCANVKRLPPLTKHHQCPLHEPHNDESITPWPKSLSDDESITFRLIHHSPGSPEAEVSTPSNFKPSKSQPAYRAPQVHVQKGDSHTTVASDWSSPSG